MQELPEVTGEGDAFQMRAPRGGMVEIILEPLPKRAGRIGSVFIGAPLARAAGVRKVAAHLLPRFRAWSAIDLAKGRYRDESPFAENLRVNYGDYLARAQAALARNKVSNAQSFFRLHLKKRPEDAESWAALAAVYLRTRSPRQALFAYDKALALRPNESNWHAAREEVAAKLAKKVSRKSR